MELNCINTCNSIQADEQLSVQPERAGGSSSQLFGAGSLTQDGQRQRSQVIYNSNALQHKKCMALHAQGLRNYCILTGKVWLGPAEAARKLLSPRETIRADKQSSSCALLVRTAAQVQHANGSLQMLMWYCCCRKSSAR